MMVNNMSLGRHYDVTGKKNNYITSANLISASMTLLRSKWLSILYFNLGVSTVTITKTPHI